MLNTNNIGSSLADIAQKRDDGNLSKVEQAEKKINNQKKSFFNLLAVQLQNQDPTAPMDTNQMAAQIFTLNSLEQQLESNKTLQEIRDILQKQQLSQPSSHIGKAVIYEGNTIHLKNSQAEFDYLLDRAAKTVTLEIRDSKGMKVYEAFLETSAGRHNFKWEGLDAKGIPLKDGIYNIMIKAKDAHDEPIWVKSFVSGKIDGIITENNDYKFSIDGNEVDKDKIKVIKEAQDIPQAESSELVPKTEQAKESTQDI